MTLFLIFDIIKEKRWEEFDWYTIFFIFFLTLCFDLIIASLIKYLVIK